MQLRGMPKMSWDCCFLVVVVVVAVVVGGGDYGLRKEKLRSFCPFNLVSQSELGNT